MVMTLQLTRMVVMMAKPNMGWVKTVRAILLIGWKGKRIHIAFVAENLAMEDGNHKDSYFIMYLGKDGTINIDQM